MNKGLTILGRTVGQVIVYGLIAVTFGYFSMYPSYTRFPTDQAQILLSFSHVGQHKGACRKLTQQETAGMQVYMHRGKVCPRERLPVRIELHLADTPLVQENLMATGIASDGAAQIYRRFTIPAGPHRITARLRDSARQEGFDYEAQTHVTLASGEKYVIDFRSELGGFMFGTNRPDKGRQQ
jgi:hypothetical protein